ncbi:hypothetical protein RJ639_012984 [Escallonia herrerae]|uniref:Ribosomal protein S2 n=1 Tax=Escallonia herrerae TaxID=1293975 RepID=A0AA88VJC8_9ASTE|nr:hypothetical protein RJ639_012984 [Escallonia herrerae]
MEAGVHFGYGTRKWNPKMAPYIAAKRKGVKGVPAKEVLTKNAQSPKPFDAHTLKSKLSSYDLKLLRERCEISLSVKLRLPDEAE